MKYLFLNTSLFLLFSVASFAQGNEGNDGLQQNSTSILNKVNMLDLVDDITKKEDALLLQNKYQNNGVIINQIGASNYVNTKLKAEDIKVVIVQNGAENQLTLDKAANEIAQKIVQEGRYNSITDFSLYANYNVNMEIIQKGDNQNVQNYGTNSLSKNMKVIQSGNGASVIILNK
ncbi:hypothetical protein [Flavobacterium frigoris]|uniref:Minor curlin subunit n=1 Tax=Flavobacterium frigoris (strain PS1) TaxID=1086011 RepID=H7FR17_FLAFP|nr:hypothetical protein [Flavobacterium frigoris]EIA09037.1 hypothetical protein HJ01_01803 [Flavobacterium frigoris PS1]